jgi:hypothetical protein
MSTFVNEHFQITKIHEKESVGITGTSLWLGGAYAVKLTCIGLVLFLSSKGVVATYTSGGLGYRFKRSNSIQPPISDLDIHTEILMFHI